MSSYKADTLELLTAARREGIAVNHRLIQPISLCGLRALPPIVDIREPFIFSAVSLSQSEEDEFKQFPFYRAPTERLQLDKETTLLICTATKLAAEGATEATKLLEQKFQHRKNPRLEEPLVRDPSVRIRHDQRLRLKGVESYPVNEEDDEGLNWSRSTRDQVKAFEKSWLVEKLEMPRDVLACIGAAANPIGNEWESKLMERTIKSGPERLSPPLLPRSALRTPSPLPFPELNDLEPVDAGTDSDLIAELTEPLFVRDYLGPANSPTSSPSHYTQCRPATPSPARILRKPDDLKLEVPLTSPISSGGRVCFNFNLETDNHQLPLKLKIDETPGKVLLEGLAGSVKVQLERELAQEQLQHTDSLRLKLPVLNFAPQKPPWELARSNTEKFRDIQSWGGLAAREVHGLGSLQIETEWCFFQAEHLQLHKEQVESMGGNEEVFLVSVADCEAADKALLNGLWSFQRKDDGWDRDILDEPAPRREPEDIIVINDDCETKIQSPRPQRSNDTLSVEDLIKNRKRKGAPKTGNAPSEDHFANATKRTRIHESSSQGKFCAINSLEAFMTVRARTVNYTTEASKLAANHENSGRDSAGKGLEKVAKTPLPASSHPEMASTPIARTGPNIVLPPEPKTFIVSTNLLSQRTLFRYIKSLYPSANFVERDFSSLISYGNPAILAPTTTRPSSDTLSSSIILPRPVEDADLILSPKCGLIITTLQKLRQRCLPGEMASFNSGSTVKDRLLRVCGRYGRLILLIHNPQPSSSDRDVIARIIGFTAALSCAVAVRVADGNEELLARWIVVAMAAEQGEYKLIEEETQWEQFLRVVGLNAFAAQTVIRQFTLQEKGDMRRFLAMEAKEKVRLFAGVVGRDVMRRVADVLGRGWEDLI